MKKRKTHAFRFGPHAHKVVIFGNHELTCDPFHQGYVAGCAELLTNATLLNDSGCEVDGVKFWGSPMTPEFCGWAFNRARGAEIDKHWRMIPTDTDVLITHGPPSHVLDTVGHHPQSPHLGCERLLVRVDEVRPKVHVFGHIHGGYGQREHNGTIFVNASSVNERYAPENAPIVVSIASPNRATEIERG